MQTQVQSRRIFKDAKLDSEFKKNGFIVLPVLTSTETRHFQHFYNQVHPAFTHGFRLTLALAREVIQPVSDFLNREMRPRIHALLDDYKYVIGTFYTKPANDPTSFLPMHQDWTILNESEFTSINAWCPLVETHESNGPLEVIPFSHLIPKTIRGQGIASPIGDIITHLDRSFYRTIYLKPGDCIIFAAHLIHGSPKPNLTDSLRVAASCGFVPNGAQLLHYFSPRPNWVQKFEISPDFFYRYFQEGRYPKEMKFLDVISEKNRGLTYQELEQSGWLELAKAGRSHWS